MCEWHTDRRGDESRVPVCGAGSRRKMRQKESNENGAWKDRYAVSGK